MINENDFISNLKEMLKTEVKITMDSDLLDIEEWDSLSMINFIVMCEEKFGVKVEKSIIAEAVLVEDLYEAVK